MAINNLNQALARIQELILTAGRRTSGLNLRTLHTELTEWLDERIADIEAGGGGGGSGVLPVENRYSDISALLADQGNQTNKAIQRVDDASTDSSVDSGYAYYEYLGTTVGDLTDYRKLSEEESMDVDITVITIESFTITDSNNDSTFAINSGTTVIEFVLDASLTETFAPVITGFVDGKIYTLRILKRDANQEIDFASATKIYFNDGVLPLGVWDTVAVDGYLLMHGYGLPNGAVVFDYALNTDGYAN